MISRYDILLVAGVLLTGTLIYKIYVQSETMSHLPILPKMKAVQKVADERLEQVKKQFARHLRQLKRGNLGKQGKSKHSARIVVRPPAKPPAKPPSEPSIKPPSEPPAKPPSEPPTKPPSEPPTKPPSEPPSEPPRKPPSEPPSKPPAKPVKLRKVVLAMGILSKLSAIARRTAIRDTWMQVCLDKSAQVACIFFSDEINRDTPNRQVYLDEKKRNKDMEYMPYKGGFNFALRLVWMLKYFGEHYDFDYFLRVDDDYFICLDRLLKELPYRPKTGVYWGWVHCVPGIVRVDEGFMIWSKDVVFEILSKANTTLMCHSFGDQAAALWMRESKIRLTYFMDNARLAHEATSYTGNKFLVPELCSKYIGLHGTYPEYMHKYWDLYTVGGRDNNIYSRKYSIPPIIPFKRICGLSTAFDFNAFGHPYHAVPRPCKDNPVFIDPRREFPSRERG